MRKVVYKTSLGCPECGEESEYLVSFYYSPMGGVEKVTLEGSCFCCGCEEREHPIPLFWGMELAKKGKFVENCLT